MSDKIPVTVLVVTRNEEANLPRCLSALERFDEIIVVDSLSTDTTADIARSFGVTVMPFVWNGAYPKKRQWCLDHLRLRHDRVFFVDADEEVTPRLCDEIASLDWACAGYFVRGVYVVGGKPLRFGLTNNKLCLFDRRKIMFPVVDDLDIPGMGEIEGHYQPVLKPGCKEKIGSLRSAVLHHALEDIARHEARHKNYAIWERGMRARRAYPQEPTRLRKWLKAAFGGLPLRPLLAFLHSYIIKLGIFDGMDGFFLARCRYLYYKHYT
jgi:glycosyltransferase involved in cell wall biosynthesis